MIFKLQIMNVANCVSNNMHEIRIVLIGILRLIQLYKKKDINREGSVYTYFVAFREQRSA